MKNKIFLTSMLAVLVACPAFAEYGVTPAPNESGYIRFGENDTGTSVNAPCQANPLTFEGDDTLTSGTFIFTAGWAPQVYNVTYDNGTCGGTGVTDTRTYNVAYPILGLGSGTGDSGVTLPTGYTFNGWSETVNGTDSGETRNNPYTYAADSLVGDITLTANCSANTYNVRYDCNGGSFTTAYSNGGSNYEDWDNPTTHSQEVVYGGQYAFLNPSDVCEKAGENTSAWNCYIDTDPQGASVSAINTSSWSTANNVVCYASWAANVINLRWELDGGQMSVNNPATCDYGVAAGDTGGINGVQKPTRTGYDFTGWYITDYEQPSEE